MMELVDEADGRPPQRRARVVAESPAGRTAHDHIAAVGPLGSIERPAVSGAVEILGDELFEAYLKGVNSQQIHPGLPRDVSIA